MIRRAALLVVLWLPACATYAELKQRGAVEATEGPHDIEGYASWYDVRSSSAVTASGEPLDDTKETCAHRTLPFGTRVRVVRTDKPRETVCRVNDRGPFSPGRVIDVSRASAAALDLVTDGTAPVRLDVVAGAAARPAPGRIAGDDLPRPRDGSGGYCVQVGAFRESAGARELAFQLEPDFNDARVEPGGGLYRVRVGTALSRGDAAEHVARLKRRGLTAFVVADDR